MKREPRFSIEPHSFGTDQDSHWNPKKREPITVDMSTDEQSAPSCQRFGTALEPEDYARAGDRGVHCWGDDYC